MVKLSILSSNKNNILNEKIPIIKRNSFVPIQRNYSIIKKRRNNNDFSKNKMIIRNINLKKINNFTVNNLSFLNKNDKQFLFNNQNKTYLYIEVLLNNKNIESRLFDFNVDNGTIYLVSNNELNIPLNWNQEIFNDKINPYVLLMLFLTYQYINNENK